MGEMKSFLAFSSTVPKDSGFELTKTLSDADHAGCLNSKSTSGEYIYLGDNCKLDVKESKTAQQCYSRAIRGVICKLCSSNVDEDTTSRLWLQLQQNTVMGIMPTKIELTLEQSQHGVNNDVLVANCSSLRVLKPTPIMWAEVGEGQLIGPELVQETNEKISQIKDRLKAARDCVIRFGKKGKLTPRFVGPFEIIEKVVPVAYRLDLPEELNGVHDTFHVSNLKKCLADPTLKVPLDEIRVDAKLKFVEEPVGILEREFKKLKRRRIAILKVRWNSKRGPEFTWKRED
ncbi:hypothetical protein Tco_1184966 [Tanacetum coccineum]